MQQITKDMTAIGMKRITPIQTAFTKLGLVLFPFQNGLVIILFKNSLTITNK